MAFDVLVLNSGEWVLGAELPASPWYLLIYRQRGEPLNELHLWLPREQTASGDYAYRRYWVSGSTRWCVEMRDPERAGRPGSASRWLRFISPDGRVLWAERRGAKGLGDLSDSELTDLLSAAREGSYSGI